jgi:SAM-dependent methyltransferase
MAERDTIRAFYKDNPRMVSSPFGGVDGIHDDLLIDVLGRLEIAFSGTKVLDVGCGRGFVGDVLGAVGADYTGLDFVVSRGGFRLAQGDAACLPFDNDTFDLVTCIDASEHFPQPEAAAAEFYRVLKPGGVFFLSAPNYGNVAGVVKKVYEGLGWYERNSWAPFGRWQAQEHELPLTPAFIRRLYGGAGFEEIRGIGYETEVGLGLFPWVDHPRMPEAIQFRLQRLFKWAGPTIASACPAASLHIFWRMNKPVS